LEKQKRVFRAIKSEVDRTELNVKIDTLFFHDAETGEAIPVLDVLGEDADNALRKIQTSLKKDTTYSIIYQDTLLDLATHLSGGEMRVIMYLVGVMKYENAVFGITLRDVAGKINSGVNTVKTALVGLKKRRLIIETGKGKNKVIHVNPSIAWKGNWFKKRSKVDMFCTEDNEDAITNKRKQNDN
jgi:hypothetical protein